MIRFRTNLDKMEEYTAMHCIHAHQLFDTFINVEQE
jgi:hypothetical protein